MSDFLSKLAEQARKAANDAQAKLKKVGDALLQQANAVNKEASQNGGHVLVFGAKKSRRVKKVKKSRSKKSRSKKSSKKSKRKTSRRKSKSRKH